MALRVGVVGVSFKTAGLLLREAVAKSAKNFIGEKGVFFPHPTVLLTTCNRTEIYFSGKDLAQVQSDVMALLCRYGSLSFGPHLYSYFGLDCFAHLCRVTAGLDSALLGETEIQRQVKVAYAKACEQFILPSCLHYLFQKGFKVAKTVRQYLSIEQGMSPLFERLRQLGEQTIGPLKKRKVLLVGYSAVHRALASYLMRHGIKDIVFCTRDPTQVSTWSAHGRDLWRHWHAYDLISCASAADDFLIRGSGKPGQVLFDLSVPRMIDPKVTSRGATLYNVEQIAKKMISPRCAVNGTIETD